MDGPLQGYLKVFRHLKCDICGWLVHVNKNCSEYQILIGIMPTFSENFFQINQVWPQLQPKTRSEAILRMFKSLHNFIIDSLQKCILEAAIDRLDIGDNFTFQSRSKNFLLNMAYLTDYPRVYPQNGICIQKYHFWPINDCEKWSRNARR